MNKAVKSDLKAAVLKLDDDHTRKVMANMNVRIPDNLIEADIAIFEVRNAMVDYYISLVKPETITEQNFENMVRCMQICLTKSILRFLESFQ